MEPSWDLVIPSPLRVDSLSQHSRGSSQRIGDNSSPNTPSVKLGSLVDNSFTIIDPMTPPCQKMSTAADEPSPQTNVASAECGAFSNKSWSQHLDFPKIFVPMKNCSAADLKELDCSVIATIEQNRETYICMHDVSNFVSKKVGGTHVSKNWRHYDERTFLFAFPDRLIRDKFLQCNREVCVGDAAVTFKPWKPAVGTVKKPCHFKVWLRLSGMPVEHFSYNTVERALFTFGRLYKCNLAKKNSYVGCFYVMIDCPDVDDIKSRVILQTDDDSEIPVFVDKLYACPLDVYNAQPFCEDQMGYDEILAVLMNTSKLIFLQ